MCVFMSNFCGSSKVRSKSDLIECASLQVFYQLCAGVHIIPKIAGFLDSKIIFCPQLKKNAPNCKKNAPQLKKHFQIPLSHLPPFALPLIIKKCPQL